MLGSALTKIFRAAEPAVVAEDFLAERSWDQRVARLQQRAAARLLGRSGYRVLGTRGLSRPGLRQKHRFFHAVMVCPDFSSCLPWRAYTILPNVDLDIGLFRIFCLTLEKNVSQKQVLEKGAFSNEDPCNYTAL